MRAALSYTKSFDAVVINHAEDRSLTAGASVHEGRMAHRLGIPAAPETAEAVMVWRDVLLAGLTGGRLHVAHVSAQDSLEALKSAKDRGWRVTAEAAPHHLLLSDEALAQWGYNPVTKVNPPLRPESSRQALLKALRTGLIDVVASDHAPHHRDEKALPYSDAPFGISGLETIVAVLMTAVIEPGLLEPLKAWALMTSGPDRVLNLGFAGIRPDAPADLTLIDPKVTWQVDPSTFESLGKNTPLAGMTLTGQARATMVAGQWTMREGEVRNARLSQIS
jgi:dihydroorotase